MGGEATADSTNPISLPNVNRSKLNHAEVQNLGTILTALSNRGLDFDLKLGGLECKVRGILGEGGSKTVYNVQLVNDLYALALPNSVDGPSIAREKWNKTLKEPEHTDYIRKVGIPVNTLSKIVPLTLNGHGFLGILMHRYSDLPFTIMDGKNTRSLTQQTPFMPPNGLSVKNFIPFFSSVVQDCAALLRNNVQLGSDCFNICIFDGTPRLYLNDLGASMKVAVNGIKLNDMPWYAHKYASRAMDAWASVFSFDDIKHHKTFFKVFDNYDKNNPDTVASQLCTQILQSI